MSTIRITALAAMLAVAAATVAFVPVASAKDGRDVRVAGTCTQDSTAKLKLSPEDGRIEVEFEVDQNRNGVAWRVTLRRNGVLVAATRATSTRRAGRSQFAAWSPARAARVTAVATRASGERCTASAAL